MKKYIKIIKNNNLIILTALVIVLSFITFTIISVGSVYDAIRSDELRMTYSFSQNVYEAINKELQAPINAGRAIVSTETLKDILKNEEDYSREELEDIFQHYLQNYISSFDYSTISIISDKSGEYYTQLGFNKVIDPVNDEHDIWYTLFLDQNEEYSFDIDVDEVNGNQWTLFLNIRINDEEGNLLGVTGIGMDMTYLQNIIADLEKEYGITVYFVDKAGNLQLGSNNDNVSGRILNQDSKYIRKDATAEEIDNKYVVTRYIEDIGWYMVVEKTNDFRAVTINIVKNNIVTMFSMLILVVVIISYFIRRKQRQLIMESEEARQSNEAKGRFLANMSHEIRTPINGILGMDEMLLKICTDEKQIEYAKNIQSAGSTLLSIVNDILDISKIESGKMEILETEYELFSILNDCYNINIFRIKNKGINFVMNINPEVPSKYKGDDVRVKQVLNNLLSNAAKYTVEGEITLEVTYKMAEDGFINLIISVRDTGMGIREEDLPKLFDSFTRVDEEKNRNIEGTGLGLNLCYNLVKLMNGDIKVRSVYGEGSEFTVYLPQKVVDMTPMGDFEDKYKEFAKIKDNEEIVLKAPEARVLVVDDVEMNLLVVKGLLEKTEVIIDTATNGNDCLIKMNSKEYDIVFLDHIMPGMDGITTFEKWKESDKKYNINTPIIMLTANAITGSKNEYLSVGFSDYISKPVAEKDLLEMLIKYLPISKYRIEDSLVEESKSYNIVELKKRIYDKYEAAAKDKKLLFDVVIDSLLPVSYVGEITSIEGVIDILLEEAIKHTDYGKVVLSIALNDTESENLDRICAGNSIPLVFMIMDTGDSFDFDSPSVRNAFDMLVKIDSKLEIDNVPKLGASAGFCIIQSVNGDVTVNEYISINNIKAEDKSNTAKEKDVPDSLKKLEPVADTSKETTSNETVAKDIISRDKNIEDNASKDNNSHGDNSQDELLIEGLDISKGLVYVQGNKDLFMKILKEYVKSSVDFANTLTNSYASKDMTNYRIGAHSTKSGSYSIGAEALGDLAKEMEFAARDNDIDFVEAHHEEFLQKLKTQAALVKNALLERGFEFEEAEDKVSDRLLAAIDDFDMDKSLSVLDEIESKEGKSELSTRIRNLIEDFNYLEAREEALKL